MSATTWMRQGVLARGAGPLECHELSFTLQFYSLYRQRQLIFDASALH